MLLRVRAPGVVEQLGRAVETSVARPSVVGFEARTELAHDMPTRSVLAASPKKVLPHYFPPFPVSQNNGTITGDPMTQTPTSASGQDYHQRYWLPPGRTEGGTDHAAYGGYVRDRKRGVLDPRLGGVRPASSGWQVRDRRIIDIQLAIDAGFDGFFPDILGVTAGSQRWTQLIEILDAADQENASRSTEPKFWIGLMPDGTTGGTSDPTVLAQRFLTIATRPSLLRYTHNGVNRLLVAPYMPERAPANAGSGGSAAVAFWREFCDVMAAGGHPVWLLPVYTNTWTAAAQAPSFNAMPEVIGHSRWGDRNPSATSSATNANRGAPAYCRTNFPGKIWMHFASPQDCRPYSQKYWDAGGSRNLIASFMAAIDGDADWVQIPTWDDQYECSSMSDTYGHGHVYKDICTFMSIRFKLGYWPTVIRDNVMIFHRREPASGVTYTGPQTQFMVRQGTDNFNEVEALAFLTDPATVEILHNGIVIESRDFTQAEIDAVGLDIGKGMVRLLAGHPSSGTVSARVRRFGSTVTSITSPWTISTTQISEDMAYKAAGSLRGAQF